MTLNRKKLIEVTLPLEAINNASDPLQTSAVILI